MTYLAVMARNPAADPANSEQDGERDDEEKHGERRSALGIAAIQALEDVERRDLGLERQVPGDQDDGAELADRAGERKRDAGEKRGQHVREHDPAEDREPICPE